MKFREIFRFELAHQARGVWTWLSFAVLFVVAYLVTWEFIDDAPSGAVLANSPYVIALTTVITNMLWLLMATSVAGNAAARDAETRMDPLIATAPVSKAAYLGGRFLAAFTLNAILLLAVPAGMLFALLLPGVEPELLGPSQPAAYLSAYAVLALPTAFRATALQFALAILTRRAAVSYLGSVLLAGLCFGSGAVTQVLHLSTLGQLMDPVGLFGGVFSLSKAWTPVEKNTLLIGLQGPTLANAVVWTGIGLGMLAFTYLRFHFAHHAPSSRLGGRRNNAVDGLPGTGSPAAGNARSFPHAMPQVRRAFGFSTHVRQTLAIAQTSFWAIATSWGGLILLAVAVFLALLGPELLDTMGVPVIPRTGYVLTFLKSTMTDAARPWVLFRLLIIFFAGELIWRERDARLSEIADATPVPEWVLFLGKFLGLGLALVGWVALLTVAGMVMQARLGYFHFEIGLYLQALFGLQLVDYLLFALLALTIHAVVNQKHAGYLVAVAAYGAIVSSSFFGIEDNLLVYGAGPAWSYSDMRGFGASLEPWLWFKLYWAAWALLLAVVARLLWVRGTEPGLGARVALARQRFTRPATAAAAAAVGLILVFGGVIFYNTNLLNGRAFTAAMVERGAAYERRYGQYERIPQPTLTGISLQVEIFPERREVEIRGSYRLVNQSTEEIDAIHVATAPNVETGTVAFDRPATAVLVDEDLGHRIYTLKQPLKPGDTLQLSFAVRYAPHGFRNSGADAFVTAQGAVFTNEEWLPAIGYQPNRELLDAGVRQQHGLSPRSDLPSLEDTAARQVRVGGDRIIFDAVVGTSGDQIAVAPGALQRTWTDGERRYFQYVADVPITNDYTVFSAAYAVREEQWNPATGRDVTIQIYHHPEHAEIVDRMVASVRASLDHYTRQFGPYPYSYIRLIENPARGMGVDTEAATIDYGEGFALLNPGDSPQDLDLVFAVIAHGVAHEWWGTEVAPADVEGAGLLTVSLETYSAMRVVEESLGAEHLQRYLRFMRVAYETQGTRAASPLLRATGSFAVSRKGPLALYALREYIGKDRVDDALRHLLEKYGAGTLPLATSLDLYGELQAVTPDAYQSLLHDLFEVNTHWELKTERATAVQTDEGTWRVTIDVQARKVVVDEEDVETEVPMDDWVPVGVFGPAAEGEELGEPLSLEMHRIRSGRQTIILTVSGKPDHAGIDPNHLFMDPKDLEQNDNIEVVKVE